MNIDKKEINREFIRQWRGKGIHPLLLSILDRRGFSSSEDLLFLFSPLIELLPSPFSFPSLEKALTRLKRAGDGNEKVAIFGDRDVDGTTSVSILYHFLKERDFNVIWDVPVGDDCYGLSMEKVEMYQTSGIGLLLSVDCGITNSSEVKKLNEYGIDTIIIDHHEPVDPIPDAYAIVNPKYVYEDDFKDLAAVFVTFLFVLGYLISESEWFNKTIPLLYQNGDRVDLVIMKNLILVELREKLSPHDIQHFENDILYVINYQKKGLTFLDSLSGNQITKIEPVNTEKGYSFLQVIDDAKQNAILTLRKRLLHNVPSFNKLLSRFLPLVMLGTIADIMPMQGPNRIVVKHGIEIFKKFNHGNLIKLCRKMDVNRESLTARDLAWTICPCLNAAGRMGDAAKTVDFLLNYQGSDQQVEVLLTFNNRRKLEGEEAFNNFIIQHKEILAQYNNDIAFFYSDTLNKGITGITASKISRHLNCPTFVAAKNGDKYHGSIRGDSSSHFVDFLGKADHILEQFGGHKAAAGFRFHEDKLDLFKEFLRNHSNILKNSEQSDTISIDAEIPVDFLSGNILPLVQALEPFGYQFENPVFLTRGLTISEYSTMGKKHQHLRFRFNGINQLYNAIFWNKADWFSKIHTIAGKYSVIYSLRLNRFRGTVNLQMEILNIFME